MLGKGALFLSATAVGLAGAVGGAPAWAMSFGPVSGSIRLQRAQPRLRHAPPTPANPRISLTASPARVTIGRPVALSGKVRGEVTSVKVVLYARPYPYTKPVLAATTTTAPNGSYSFRVRPDRRTRYRAYVLGTTSHALATVTVLTRVVAYERALPLGRAKIVVVVIHPRNVAWRRAKVDWWFAPGRSHFFRGVRTRAHRLSPTKLVLVSTRALPAGFYKWRACFHAPNDQALADPRPAPGCTGQGFRGHASLPVGFPSPAAIASAERYLDSRGGHTALAVVDTEGRMSGVRNSTISSSPAAWSRRCCWWPTCAD